MQGEIPRDSFFLLDAMGQPRSGLDVTSRRVQWLLDQGWPEEKWEFTDHMTTKGKVYRQWLLTFQKRLTAEEKMPYMLVPKVHDDKLLDKMRTALQFCKELTVKEHAKKWEQVILNRNGWPGMPREEEHEKLSLVHVKFEVALAAK